VTRAAIPLKAARAFARLQADARQAAEARAKCPGGQRGNDSVASAAGSRRARPGGRLANEPVGSCRDGAAVLRVPPHHNGCVSIPPETRYARNGAIHLAYQVLGGGPPNLLVVNSGPNTHVDYMWAEPSLARFIRRLASFSRLIVYDNRGVGLSDPVPGGAAPTMDEQVDDIRAILVETGCQRAVLMGNWAGCAPALVFAATHPGRVESLILLGGYARLRAGAGYPQGWIRPTLTRSSMRPWAPGAPGRSWT
jgi:hypothetical protein